MLRYACDTTNWLLQPNTLCHWNLRGKWSHSTWRMESGTNTTTLRFHKIQAQILKSSHNSKLDGHPGQEKILSHVNWSFMWPSMTAHVQKYINGCNSCQKVKSVAQRLFGTPERGLILGGGGGYGKTPATGFIAGFLLSDRFDRILRVIDWLTKSLCPNGGLTSIRSHQSTFFLVQICFTFYIVSQENDSQVYQYRNCFRWHALVTESGSPGINIQYRETLL